MTNQQKLDVIAREIEKCEICKIGKSGKAVPGEGNSSADIVFLGEAPGKTEAAQGRPFIGRSGKFLRKNIEEVGLSTDDVFITSPVKYLPDYVTPKPSDIEHGKIHLEKQLAIIKPKFIVLLGSVASYAMLSEKIPVLKRHGEVIRKKGKTFFITVHPASAIRFSKMRVIFKEDFKKLKEVLRRV